jgi:hypothetical protein
VLRDRLGLCKTDREPFPGQAVKIHQGVSDEDDPSGNRFCGGDSQRAKATQRTQCRRVLYLRRQLGKRGQETGKALTRWRTKLGSIPQEGDFDLLRA